MSTIPRSILRIFNTDEARDKAFNEDVEVLVENGNIGAEINKTKRIIQMRGQFYAYRSPSFGMHIKAMPVDKIELVERIDDIQFVAAAMERIQSTKNEVEVMNKLSV